MRQPLALGRYGTRQNNSGAIAPGGRSLDHCEQDRCKQRCEQLE